MKIIRPRLAFLNSSKSLSNFQGYVPVDENSEEAYFFDMLYFKQSAISPIEIVQITIYDKKYKADLTTAPTEKLDQLIKSIEKTNKKNNLHVTNCIFRREFDHEKNEFTENGTNVELGQTLLKHITDWLASK